MVYAHIYAHMAVANRKSTNLSLDASLLQEAKALKVNLSRAAERGVRAAVAEARTAAWQAENAPALESSNSYVEAHGLPLDRHRQF